LKYLHKVTKKGREKILYLSYAKLTAGRAFQLATRLICNRASAELEVVVCVCVCVCGLSANGK